MGGKGEKEEEGIAKDGSSGDYVPPDLGADNANASARLIFSSATLDSDSDDSEDSDDTFTSKETFNDEGTANSNLSYTGVKTILRYRGFSTSIQSLFLDEALVCASMGCFGLILSNRTEYFMQLRNDRRGVRGKQGTSNQTLPSRIVGYALLLTVVLIATTFVVWGFGNDEYSSRFTDGFFENYGYSDDGKSYSGYDDDGDDDDDDDDAEENDEDEEEDGNYYDDDYADDGNNNGDDGWKYGYDYGNRKLDTEDRTTSMGCPHHINGIFKIRDMHEGLWEPTINFLKDEWNRPTDRRLDSYSSNVGSVQEDHLASDIRVSIFFVFVVILGILGRRRRMRTRYNIVRARAQEDHLYYASKEAGFKKVAFQDSREDQYEGACSHTLCGCYPADSPAEKGELHGDIIDHTEVIVGEEGVTQQQQKRYYENFGSRSFSCLMASCCGVLCKCWCQCLSICALAQEAREMRLLVPTKYQRVDYITHQPFHEYQKDVNDLRRGWLGKSNKKLGVMTHFHALSRLSRYILGIFIGSIVVLVLTVIFNPNASFSWNDLVILGATFLQSFTVLFLVHWIFHKSDLSLDAVIKFFAAGFLIAVPASFVFEGIMVNLTIMMTYLTYVVADAINGEAVIVWITAHYRILWIVAELVNAFIIAAVVEELCKYYTFRCVEHPDLIFLTGLARPSEDERKLQGGTVKYPFSPDQVESTNKKEGPTLYDDSTKSHRNNATPKKGNGMATALRDAEEEEFYEDEHDVRTQSQKAAAITTGMISVAVGLACAENFIYVFMFGGTDNEDDHSGGLLEEWIVLLFRSLFPVHALAAAMQSVNVIRKFVACDDDGNKRIGVGTIILPAVIMHGCFDAVLLGINVYMEDAYDQRKAYNPVLVNIVAWMSIILVMVIGFLWYYREHRNQMETFEFKERREAMWKIAMEGKGKEEEIDTYTEFRNSSELSSQPTASEVELV